MLVIPLVVRIFLKSGRMFEGVYLKLFYHFYKSQYEFSLQTGAKLYTKANAKYSLNYEF